MITLSIVLALLVLILCMPVGVHVHYNANGFRYRLYIGPVKLPQFKKKPAKKSAPARGKQEQPKKKATFEKLIGDAKTVLSLLGRFKRKFTVKHFFLRVRCGGENASAVAIQYGLVWAALGNISPMLQKLFVIREPKVSVLCDYKRRETSVVCNAVIGITVGRLLWCLAGFLTDYKLNSKKAVQ